MKMSKKNFERWDRFRKFILDFIFSNRCACCGEVVEIGKDICTECDENLVHHVNGCIKCGYPKEKCVCKSTQFEFDGIFSPYLYEGAARKGVFLMKREYGGNTAEFFGDKISELLTQQNIRSQIDLIASVPQTKKREKEKGFNQSHLMAKRISKRIDVPYDRSSIAKLYETKLQHTCDAVHRMGNVYGVFEADSEICFGKNILLVDDVTTCRATLNECAKMLKIAGAKKVYCAVATVNQ